MRRNSEGKKVGLVLLLYAAFVCLVYHPIVLHPGTHILAGSQVGGLFVWEFWWIKTAPHLWHSSFLMYPLGVPFLIQSPFPHILAYIVQFFLDAYTTYTLLNFLSYVGSGLTLYLLAFHLTQDRLASFFAGFVFMFSHYKLTQHVLGHLNESSLVFVPLFFLSLLLLIKKVDTRRSVFFFGSALGVIMSSTYLFLSVLVLAFPAFLLGHFYGIKAAKKQKKLFVRLFTILSGVGVLFVILYWPSLKESANLIGGSEVSALSVVSFFDFPAWHPNSLVQKLRTFTSGFVDQSLVSSAHLFGRSDQLLRAKPENLMGFLGFNVWALLIFGFIKGLYRKERPWLFVLIVGFVFSLGPVLQFTFQETHIPLPFLVFQKLPFFNNLRSPGRLIMLVYLVTSVFVAISLSHLLKSFKKSLHRGALVLGLVLFYSWEMGLHAVGHVYTPLRFSPALEYLQKDPGSDGLLVLPLAVKRNGDLTLNVQEHMLYQPLHKKPLVLGRPTRHTVASLALVESTDYLYELTHPIVLPALFEKKELASRRQDLIKRGRSILADNKIKYVWFQKQERFFSQSLRNQIKEFLVLSLGKPVLEDETEMLFQIYD